MEGVDCGCEGAAEGDGGDEDYEGCLGFEVAVVCLEWGSVYALELGMVVGIELTSPCCSCRLALLNFRQHCIPPSSTASMNPPIPAASMSQ